MKIKNLFTIILFIFMLNSVFASLSDDTQGYFTLDNNLLDSSGNGNVITNSGADTTTSGIINGAYDFIITNGDYITYLNSTDIDSFSIWINPDTEITTADSMGLTYQSSTIEGIRLGSVTVNVANEIISIPIGGNSNVFYWDSSDISSITNTFHHIVLVWDNINSKYRLYYDGVNKGLAKTFGSPTKLQTGSFDIGRFASGSFNGVIDEISLFNESLNSNNVSYLYASGSPTEDQQYPYNSLNLATKTNLQDYYNTSNIRISLYNITEYNMTYLLDNSYSFNYTIKTITNPTNPLDAITILEIFNLSEELHNISFIANNGETNLTGSFTIDTTPPTINIFNSSAYNSFYIDWTTRFNYSDINLDSCYILYNETELNCSSYTFNSVGNKSINIFVSDLAGNSINETYTQLINPYQYFYFYDVLNSSYVSDFTFGNYSSTDNYLTIPFYDLGEGEHILNFSKVGFTIKPVYFNFTTTEILNLTTNIIRSKIVLKIYDRQTDQLLTGLTQVQILATVGYKSNTTTGLLNITVSDFINELYTIILTHKGYSPELFCFNYDNQEILNINVYMLNATATDLGFVTLKTITDTGELISGAICSILEWKPDLSSYQAVSYGETNPNGEVSLQIELGSKIYKFSCYKDDQSSTTVSQVIKVDGTTIPIILQKITLTPLNFFENFNYNLTNSSYNLTHQRITYTFSDKNNLVSTGCLNIYKKSGTKLTLIQNSCVESTIGQIQLIQDINKTYTLIAIATIEQEYIKIRVGSITFLPINNLQSFLSKYHFDIILPILFAFIGISFGLLLRPQNIYMSMFGSIIMVWISFGIVPSVISGTISVFITTICLLMWWGTS